MCAIELPAIYDDLSPGQRRWVRQEYVERQDGMCFWCNSPLAVSPPMHIQRKKINLSKFPPNFLKWPVHLQHCHKTGMTEGAVHARCNAVMWQYHGR